MADTTTLGDPHKVLDWYNRLWSRTVDLVGDFLGSELFIIDGDSLLLECFSNEKLDFSPGFQLLHATYLVEKFLQKLQQRKCVFEIVFFDRNAPFCVPVGSADDIRYLLAREAIIQHLITISSREQQEHKFDVHVFKTFHSESFKEHLLQSGAYLFMCHEGDAIDKEQGNGGDTNDDDKVLSDKGSDNFQENTDNDITVANEYDTQSLKLSSMFGLRLMICWFVTHGCNIALINNLEFRDTKVMAMVIQGSAEAHSASLVHELPRADTLDTLQPPETKKVDQQGKPTKAAESTRTGDQEKSRSTQKHSKFAPLSDLLRIAIHEYPGLTQSQYLSVVSLAVMLNAVPLDSFHEISTGATSVILHLVILQNAKLEDRVIQAPGNVNTAFFDAFLRICREVLSSTCWRNTMKKHNLRCDLSDLADGRMFFQVQAMIESLGINGVITSTTLLPFNNLASLVDRLCSTKFRCEVMDRADDGTGKVTPAERFGDKESRKEPTSRLNGESPNFTKVLPFRNAIFDEHLKPVHLEIDESFDGGEEINTKKFLELTHWHNSKPLDQKRAALTPRDWRHQKWDQLYMAEMRRYAESLLGSVGMSQTETIIVERSSDRHKKPLIMREKQPSTQKNRSKGSVGPSVREVAAATIQQKAAEREQRKRKQWAVSLRDFSKVTDAMVRSTKVEEYLSGLSKDDRCILEPEILTYLLDTLIQAVYAEKGRDKMKLTLLATHIWSVLARLMKIGQGISADTSNYVEKVCRRLGLPLVQLEIQVERPLSFKLSDAISKVPGIVGGISPVDFQLLHGGPLMDRSMDSSPDSRTPDFNPDRWQREVLDRIDEKESMFIVAPTSAGKTFISFYAMRQVLKEDNDGVLVYVAPTKALVNQIAAEVMARFSKSYPENSISKSVWAIHTRDHRINNPLTCQILITVPHILQIMLLAPSNAKTWTPRLKRIIFDEIHCIGQADDGVVWEQLLLLSPCPIIALSATVGNPEEFNSWLQRAQGTNGHNLKMIQYQHRYSDLRKYVYHPPQAFSFKGFAKTSGPSHLGLDKADGMELMHPVLSLVDRSRGIPDDFSLEPRDCLTLWKAMNDVQTNDFPVDVSLDPFNRFSATIVQKKHVVEWQKPLKDLLRKWMKDRKSPFEALLRRLSGSDTGLTTAAGVGKVGNLSASSEASGIVSSTLPLICSLHAQNALPALFFNYDRSKCVYICYHLLTELQEAEEKWKATSPKWKSDMDKWNERQKLEAKKKKTSGATKATKKKGASNDEPMSRMDQLRESASVENSQSELFDPERPQDMFSLSDFTKLQLSEFAVYAEQLKRRGIHKWLIDALERGIGVHHAGMNRKYRQICEILFRRGFLRVVIATGTLALGINMPCKTVVFSGDSVFLTALNFRQAAGRAGRRGFDLLGNVVFQHIPTAKIQRLISSRLPDLNGHFPITTSLVLRLFILLHGSSQGALAIKSINSILSQPRICLGGPEMKQTVLHFLRFSIEYLRRNHLLDSTGAPLNFAGCISHLYYTESSSFAFHALLISGYFDGLCKDIEQKEKRQNILRTLMLVMSHIFGRFPLRQSVLESYHAAEKRASSIVVLPPLPKEADQVLRAHNSRVLDTYTGYVSTFIDQHVKGHDRYLPFSGVECGGDKSAAELSLSQQPAPKITSPFYALSGHRDSWTTVSDLCESVRSGVWLEASVVPYVPVSSESQPLNAYLFDFFKHGNVQQLEAANRIRRGDVWFLLNDFSMVLATINTSLENFLNSKGGNNVDIMDMLNVGGRGDSREFETDAKFADEEVTEMGVETSHNRQERAARIISPKTSIRAGESRIIAENWDDDVVEDTERVSAKKNSKPGHPNQLKPELEPGERIDNTSRRALFLVCKAFNELKTEFDAKFRAMWA
ncbi:hypothetical protein UA08_07159 [Talaromyces atroroseus]|uniref:Helicase n=1 Tax=Talaromyces atroroseus TaxID=1441469 RepID=A0A225AVE1_TALAT|nr:hypothetical protein UA08_07159 [Talaromyces atroroseus]OKL57447.1 hypothetical protein UA08_07159 [Talaromyces atroroseus]